MKQCFLQRNLQQTFTKIHKPRWNGFKTKSLKSLIFHTFMGTSHGQSAVPLFLTHLSFLLTPLHWLIRSHSTCVRLASGRHLSPLEPASHVHSQEPHSQKKVIPKTKCVMPRSRSHWKWELHLVSRVGLADRLLVCVSDRLRNMAPAMRLGAAWL